MAAECKGKVTQFNSQFLCQWVKVSPFCQHEMERLEVNCTRQNNIGF